MPEVTIASHKWRKRTRDWSAVCDNTLKLNRTYGMVGDPSKLNSLGVCAPDCEICVTPIPGEITPKCSVRTDLGGFMVVPKTPEVLTLPGQFQLSIVGGGMTSSVDGSSWPLCRGMRPGDALKNILERSVTQTMTLRVTSPQSYESDWVYFGESTATLNFVGQEQVNMNFPPNTATRSASATREIEIKGFLSYCPWGLTIFSRIKPNSFGRSTDSGWSFSYGSPNYPRGSLDFIGPKDLYDRLFSGFLNWDPAGGFEIGQVRKLNRTEEYMQEVGNRVNTWDPFLFQSGMIGCGAHRLMENRVYNVSSFSTFGSSTWTVTNELGAVVPSNSNQPWGAVDPSYKWCQWQKIQAVN